MCPLARSEVLMHGPADDFRDADLLFGGAKQQVTLELWVESHRLD